MTNRKPLLCCMLLWLGLGLSGQSRADFPDPKGNTSTLSSNPSLNEPASLNEPVMHSDKLLLEKYLNLDELLQQTIAVSTLKASTTREAPGIVTLITSDEIANTGARDLLDLLRLVAGFEIGTDVQGALDLGVRGLWAHEGKFLLLWDGIPMNETLYGTLALGNHFPVDQIRQIEIIRGPGSAIYGGYAELAVINITTKSGKELDGIQATTQWAQTAKGLGSRTVSFSFGKAKEDLDISGHIFWGQGNGSDQPYTSYYGSTFDLNGNFQLNPYLVNLGLAYRGLEMRFLMDEYKIIQRFANGATVLQPVPIEFDTTCLDTQYTIKVGEGLTLTPHLQLKEQAPYLSMGVGTTDAVMEGMPDVQDNSFEIRTWRQTEGLTTSWDFTRQDNLIAGLETYQEQASYNSPETKFVSYANIAAFSQLLMNLDYVNLTLGGRFEQHSQYGASFVPRAGLTKVLGDLHFKMLFSQAFRVPQIENIRLNPDLKPERSQSGEFEVGYKLNNQMMLTANVYDIRLTDAIIYYADGMQEYYLNSGKIGTRGVELEYKLRDEWGFLNLSFASNTVNQNEVDLYAVPGHPNQLLGFPAYKAVLNSAIRLIGSLSLNPSLIYLSERYGYYLDGEGVKAFPAAWLANVYLFYSPLQGFKIGLGVNDLADQKPVIIQPYNGGEAPIPSLSRSYTLKINYQVEF